MDTMDITDYLSDDELNHTLDTSPAWNTSYLDAPGAESREYFGTIADERLRDADATITLIDGATEHDETYHIAPPDHLPRNDHPRFALHRHDETGYECLYDHWTQTLYDQDHTQRTLTYLRDSVINPKQFDNTVASLHTAYERMDDIAVLQHRSGGRSQPQPLETIGIMVDDEVLMLNRIGSDAEGNTEFSLARFDYTPAFDWGTTPVDMDIARIPKHALPSKKANTKSELYFLYEHVLKPHMGSEAEALAKIDALRNRYRPETPLEDVTVREVVTR